MPWVPISEETDRKISELSEKEGKNRKEILKDALVYVLKRDFRGDEA